MAKVKRVERVKAYLAAETERGKSARAKVGYSQKYGIYVHEIPPPPPKSWDGMRPSRPTKRRARHPVGMWKYLEYPARVYQREMAAIIEKNLRNKEGVRVAVLRAGRFLLALSQECVPVDTGALKASGSVEVLMGRH